MVGIENPLLGNYGYTDFDDGVDGGTGDEDDEVEEVDGAGQSRRGANYTMLEDQTLCRACGSIFSMQVPVLIKRKIGTGKGWRTSSSNSCLTMAERCIGPFDHYKAIGKASKQHIPGGVVVCNK